MWPWRGRCCESLTWSHVGRQVQRPRRCASTATSACPPSTPGRVASWLTTKTSGSRSDRNRVLHRNAPGSGTQGKRFGHRDVGSTCRAAPAVVQLAAAASVLEDHRSLTVNGVPITPLQQRNQDGPKIGALLG